MSLPARVDIEGEGVTCAPKGDKRFGITDFNRTEAVYNSIKTMTLADVVAFQQSHIKGRKYAYCILGDKNDVDMKYLKSLGAVEFVTPRQIFGY